MRAGSEMGPALAISSAEMRETFRRGFGSA
jgi:hypothetical protein